MEQTVLNVLKEYSDTTAMQKEENVLLSYGYRQSDFFKTTHRYPYLFAAIGFSAGSILFLFTFRCRRKKEAARIKALTVYLENVNTGSPGLISETGEDDFSQLQDEIYKTVTMLYQTRDAALDARNKFAENLSNIAHQLKTARHRYLSYYADDEVPSVRRLSRADTEAAEPSGLPGGGAASIIPAGRRDASFETGGRGYLYGTDPCCR